MGDERKDCSTNSKHESYNFNDSLQCPDMQKPLNSSGFSVCGFHKHHFIKTLLVKCTVMLHLLPVLSSAINRISCFAS